jgi:hypothetical protein
MCKDKHRYSSAVVLLLECLKFDNTSHHKSSVTVAQRATVFRYFSCPLLHLVRYEGEKMKFSFSEGRRECELVAESRQCQSKFFKVLKRAAHWGTLTGGMKFGQHYCSLHEVDRGLTLLRRNKTRNKLRGLSPRANYMDRPIAASRRS